MRDIPIVDGVVRVRTEGPQGVGRYGPKPASSTTIGLPCPACGEPFVAGDETTLIPLGPGENRAALEELRAGLAYAAVAIEVHALCAGRLSDA